MQVSFDYDTGRITTFLCSTQHDETVEVDDFCDEIIAVMAETALIYNLNTDFEALVNPTGRFVIGGPFADCGVTGRKIACDTYGGIGHIGGGSLCSKDPTKVDRSAAYMARKIAKDIVRKEWAERCEVQLAYAIGIAEPVSVHVDCFGTERIPVDVITEDLAQNYDLTPKGIIDSLHLLDVDYFELASYGQFTHPEVPWEQ